MDEQPQTTKSENEATQPSASSLELLDFWAVWCGPCKIMEPILTELESEYKDKLTIRKLNVDEDENQALVAKYHILSIPTYIILKDGEVAETFVGVQPKPVITSKLNSLLGESKRS